MGYMRHHAIVVTSHHSRELNAAHALATGLGCDVSAISLEKICNGYRTFCVFPDGSKENAELSKEGDERREILIGWMKSRTVIQFAELSYGDDEGDAKVTRFGG